jgi:hypothetical protein
VGAYWPIGSPHPVVADSTRLIGFVAAKSLGKTLLFCFTLDEKTRQYILCFDIAHWSAGELSVAAANISVETPVTLGHLVIRPHAVRRG